ncbi:MAG: DUF3105 domain-containing protein [Chloroflexi bacterium]|nr:DUF3105 domain-containing protein [Chloroflexota bacterium]
MSSQRRRREERQARVQERRRLADAQERRDRLVKWGMTLGTVVVVAALVGYVLWANVFQEKPGQAVSTQGNLHVQPGQEHEPYNSDPPTSGPHYGSLARWGIHTEPIAREFQIHNLEDGGVLVQYNCPEGCPDLVQQLEEVVTDAARRYDRLILAPYPDMDARIALTAWGRIDKFEEFDRDRITRFVQAFHGIDHHQIGP